MSENKVVIYFILFKLNFFLAIYRVSELEIFSMGCS